MRIDGKWEFGEDGGVRPCVQGAIWLTEQDRIEFPLLLDAGADRTVFSAQLLEWLRPFASPSNTEVGQLTGIGGATGSLMLDIPLWFKRDTGEYIKVRGPFSVFTELASSDISILGRDVTNNFRVIYDHLDLTVILLSPPHRYEITTA